MSRRGPSHSSPYGLACTNCFKAKCKCVARPGGDGCQRCHRLDKECHPSESIRRRTIGKQQDSNSRIVELESKLNSLISQLRSRNVIDSDPPDQSGPSQPPSIATSSVTAFDILDDGDEDVDLGEDMGARESLRGSLTPRAVGLSTELEMPISETDAETRLGRFRSRMLPNFGFIHLPVDMTARQLHDDRPFLYRAIICITSSSSREKLARGRLLRRSFWEAMDEIGSAMEKMDLLLGILAYIAWGWDHLLSRCSPARLMMQAMSLASELRSDKPISKDARLTALFTPGFDASSVKADVMTTKDFLEKQRAIMGCFVLSSVISTYFGQTDALRWTPQMADGLAAISAKQESPTDLTFTVQVRLQLITQKAVEIKQLHQLEQGHIPTEIAGSPALMSLATLQEQLEGLQASLSADLSQRMLILAHIHATELTLSEINHAVNSAVPLLVNQFSRMIGGATRGNTNSISAGKERAQSLWQCVRSIKGCSMALLATGQTEFADISFIQWAQLARCIVVLHHLTNTIEEPAWDRAAVRGGAVDISELLTKVAEKLDGAAQTVGEQRQDDVFTQLARMVRRFDANVTSDAVQEKVIGEETDAAWSLSRLYGGAGGSTAASMLSL